MLELQDQREETPMAVTKKELEGLNGKQLAKLIEDAQSLKTERRAGAIQELRIKWATEAEAEGFTLMEVVGVQKAPKGRPKGDGTRTPAKAKYQLSDGSTWSGRGRIPLVLREALKGTKGWNAEDGTFEDSEAREAGLAKFLL